MAVMESVTNNVGAFVAALAMIVSAGTWLVDRYWTRRKIAYRAHLDTPIEMMPHAARGMATLEVRRDGEVVADASVALLRIRNSGNLDIDEKDFDAPLSFTFGGRKVVGVEIPEDTRTDHTEEILRQKNITDKSKLVLPKFSLNRGERFKLIVLLKGNGGGGGVLGDCHMKGGKIVRDSNRVGQSTRSLVLGAVFVAAAGLLAGLLVSEPGAQPLGFECVRGDLVIEGSTAFAPLAQQVIDNYMSTCSGAKITPRFDGSLVGVRKLDGSPGDKASHIAISDGSVPHNEHPFLIPHPVAVVVFAVAVNRATRIHEVSFDKLRQIYQGRITNWKELGGQDLPISIVSRGSESGTRGVFEAKILNSNEKPVSSNDCMKKDRDPTALVVRCERPDTQSLLEEVNKIEGAIGYAETSAAATFRDVDRVQLEGRNPDIEAVKLNPDPYRFYTTEYIYSYGQPENHTLLSAFLKYVNSDTVKNILRRGGYTPCVDGQQDLTSTLCQ